MPALYIGHCGPTVSRRSPLRRRPSTSASPERPSRPRASALSPLRPLRPRPSPTLTPHLQNPQVHEVDLSVEQDLGHGNRARRQLPGLLRARARACRRYQRQPECPRTTTPSPRKPATVASSTNVYPIHATYTPNYTPTTYPEPPDLWLCHPTPRRRQASVARLASSSPPRSSCRAPAVPTQPTVRFWTCARTSTPATARLPSSSSAATLTAFRCCRTTPGPTRWTTTPTSPPLSPPTTSTIRRTSRRTTATPTTTSGSASYSPLSTSRRPTLPGIKMRCWVAGASRPSSQVQTGLPYTPFVSGTVSGLTVPNGVLGCAAAACPVTPAYKGLNGSGSSADRIPAYERNTYNFPRSEVVDLRIGKKLLHSLPARLRPRAHRGARRGLQPVQPPEHYRNQHYCLFHQRPKYPAHEPGRRQRLRRLHQLRLEYHLQPASGPAQRPRPFLTHLNQHPFGNATCSHSRREIRGCFFCCHSRRESAVASFVCHSEGNLRLLHLLSFPKGICGCSCSLLVLRSRKPRSNPYRSSHISRPKTPAAEPQIHHPPPVRISRSVSIFLQPLTRQNKGLSPRTSRSPDLTRLV